MIIVIFHNLSYTLTKKLIPEKKTQITCTLISCFEAGFVSSLSSMFIINENISKFFKRNTHFFIDYLSVCTNKITMIKYSIYSKVNTWQKTPDLLLNHTWFPPFIYQQYNKRDGLINTYENHSIVTSEEQRMTLINLAINFNTSLFTKVCKHYIHTGHFNND